MKEENTVGGRLRAAREKMGWSVRQVAAWAEIDPATISKIEKGTRPATEEHVQRLAKGLRVSADWLLGLADGS